MKKQVNFYEILGVLPSIEQEAIRPIYLALLKKYHPDVFVGDRRFAEMKSKDLNAAYEILADPMSRKKYDEALNFVAAQSCSRKIMDGKSEFTQTPEQDFGVFDSAPIESLLTKTIDKNVLQYFSIYFDLNGSRMLQGRFENGEFTLLVTQGNFLSEQEKDSLLHLGFIHEPHYNSYIIVLSFMEPQVRLRLVNLIFDTAACLSIFIGDEVLYEEISKYYRWGHPKVIQLILRSAVIGLGLGICILYYRRPDFFNSLFSNFRSIWKI